MKRLVDVVLSLVATLLTAPIVAIAMLTIWLADRRHPVYVSLRVRSPRATFPMYKLRTMVPGADLKGGASTAGNDRRLTTVGRVLRALKIDELPQLWNVLLGDMSLVGPRAQVVQGAVLYTADENALFDVRPGITDFASIVFADEGDILSEYEDPDTAYDQLIRPWKSRLGLAYVTHRRLWVDLALVGLTLVAIFSKSLARRGVQFVLVRLGVDAALVGVAGRETPLVRAIPPGGTAPAANGPFLPLALSERIAWLQGLDQLRRGPIVAIHIVLVAASGLSAWWLKYDRRLGPAELALMAESLPWLMATRGLVFIPFRLYQGLWRYTGLYDLQALLGAVVASSVVFYVVARVWFVGYPGSVMVIDALLLTFLLGGIRMARRMYSEFGSWAPGTKDVLIYGAGNVGESLARAMRNQRDGGFRPIGFIDDSPAKVGLRIHSVPVLGGRAHLASILIKSGAQEVIIATPNGENALRELTDLLDEKDISVRLAPALGGKWQSTDKELEPVPGSFVASHAPSDVEPTASAGDHRHAAKCPKCEGFHAHRSHARTYFERSRRAWSPKRLYRCHGCGWRGWLVPSQAAVSPPVSMLSKGGADADLTALDKL